MDIQQTFEKYISLFESHSPKLKNVDSDLVFNTRLSAFEKFKKLGIPDHKNENYKYAGIAEICSQDYEFSMDSRNALVDLNTYFQCEVEDMDTHVVLLSNGEYYKNNKPIEGMTPGVIVCGLSEAKVKHKEIFEKYYNQYASEAEDGFVALNSMLADDGLFIYVPQNTKVNKTIQLVNLTHGFGNKNIFKRNLFILDNNSELSLVICDHTLNNSNNFVIDVTESYLGENANLQYHALQNEPNKSGVINSHFIRLDRYSKVNSHILSLHGGIIRNNLFAKLAGEYSEANLFGLNLTDKEQRIDNYTFIDHVVPNCTSNELYKGILDDQSKGSFAGRIIVRQDAQKTLAYQTNRNLCLTPEAKMRTKPQLEIYADDVKCSHGATIGQLDESAMFYLRQRGINSKEARLMLMFAFANDILLKVNIEPLRNRISGLINARLRGEFSDCSHCLMNCHS
jgi:Fe-S cluster assembly protein SufD